MPCNRNLMDVAKPVLQKIGSLPRKTPLDPLLEQIWNKVIKTEETGQRLIAQTELVGALGQTFQEIWKKYHELLKRNLHQTGSSWALTAAEWKTALIKTRNNILEYCQKNIPLRFAEEKPFEELNITWYDIWTLYFEQRPHLLNKGDQEHKITPLMLAVIFGKQSFVKALLDLKADVDLETEEGESARTFAQHYQNPLVLQELERCPPPQLLVSWDLQ